MRYLNRIIFINSARIRYAEINLDGNVHFIGTQGVGKSTLLRAILFFYNADTGGLGIPKTKSSYTDYYFKDSNAYIIYEVVHGDEKFCVVSYKTQHKVCFRFFDGEYNRKYFVSEKGFVPDGWDGIAEQLDKSKVFYTKRKIEEHKEYRDILYGNHDGKKNELKRYSILESKDYQYIPKTIQNVFLNSKMEAEFIKQTIIMSLENDVQIKLDVYAHHLNDFETQLSDIRKFKTPSGTLQAGNLSKLHIAIKNLEREKIQIAKQLAWVVNKNEQEEPELTKRLNKQRDHETVLTGKLSKLSSAFKTKEDKIKGDIRVQDENIKTAKRLTDEYEKKGINQIITRVAKKETQEGKQKKFLDEKNLLTTQFKELEQKFKTLLDQLENQLKEFLNAKAAEKNKINADYLTYQRETKKSFDKQITELKSEHKTEIDNAKVDWEHKKQVTNNLKIAREGILHKRFFENEIRKLDNELKSYSDVIQKSSSENENSTRQIETFQKHWELDEKELQKTFERDKEKLDGQIIEANNKISEIKTYIDNSKSSLYGWLTEQYPDWGKTIGKVIDEKNVLFNTSLSPKLINKSNNFYGVEIDLTEISKTVKTVADYEKEKVEHKEKIESIRSNISELTEKLEKDKENLKRKYQPKIKERKDSIKENEYAIGLSQTKSDEATVKRNNLIEKAGSEKKTLLERTELAIQDAIALELKARDEVTRVEEELTKLIKSKENEREKKIKTEGERINQLLIDIEAEIKVEQQNSKTRKDEINSQKQKELLKKGADTTRLSEIEKELQKVNDELQFIEANRDTVSDYKKDKREYIDKVDEFKYEKQKFDRQLEQEEKKFKQQKESVDSELKIVLDLIASLDKELNLIKDDSEAFDNFKQLDFYKTIQEYFTDTTDENETDKRAKVLIDEVKEIHYEKLHGRIDELRKTTTDFLGKFSDNNVFKFNKQLTDDKSFLDFAQNLSDFIDDKRIDTIEKEVNGKFALIVSTIATQTSGLVSNSGEIQKIIGKINDDFERKNFAGVIKKIELKVEDSKNEIVQLLIMIKKYNDENAMELGTANLFSGENQEKKNKDAVDLLKQFAKKITELKRDFISLSDSFELKFKIIENDNDSGWVEKLANVGSDGTDVLVKAMLNIMLLNVFKEGASKKFKDFQLHCMMDEFGKLHPNNWRGILEFAKDRNIRLICGSPTEQDALIFDHIYTFSKDEKSITRVKRILTQYSEE
ncbi:MAG: ATP-binding protein [Chitinophagaceae bacterium]|nr:ATP-binding protein [Chitinophagaceae bacterium]